MGLYVRYDGHLPDFPAGELGGGIKSADGFHLIVPEFNAIGQLITKRKYIYNTSPYAELPRLIHKVDPLKAVGHQ